MEIGGSLKAEVYKKEEKKILELISEDLVSIFEYCGAVVAGGAITSIFTNADVNDVDVYFPSKEAMTYCLAYAFGEYAICGDAEAYTLILNNTTDKSMMFVDKETQAQVQFIHFKYFESIQDIFDTFDYTVCVGAYSFKDKGFVLHPEFLKHNAQRYLSFNKGTAFPLLSVLRADKYQKRGYNISKSELLRVVMQCMDLGLSSWDDVKEHIGGMYGYDMSDVFDEDKEFTLDEVIDQLGSLDERDIKKYNPNSETNFDELIENLYKEEIEATKDEPEVLPFKPGYYYKHVSEGLRSPVQYGSDCIPYDEGSIVNGGKMGIYVHANPLEPYSNYGNLWVELEPLEGSEILGEGCHGKGKQQLRIGGDLKVVRSFRYQLPTERFNAVDFLIRYDFEKLNPKSEGGVKDEKTRSIPF